MKKYVFLLMIIGSHWFVDAQNPPFDWSEVPVAEMQAVDNAELKARYAAHDKRAKREPLQFAHGFQTDFGPDQFQAYTDRKGRVWHALIIKSTGAYSLNIAFDRLQLPDQAQLFLYSLSKDAWKGPLKKEKRAVTEYWSPIVSGDELAVVIVLPDGKKDAAYWHISDVNHDFLGFQSISSGSCNVDVICGEDQGFPEIDQYRDLIRSVGVYSLEGRFTCSGALINTADFGCEPYFLTANHCVDDSSNYNSMVVYWNYENSTCRIPGSPESGADGDGLLDQFNSGTTLRSTNGQSDFTLVELAGELALEVNAHLAGWNRKRSAPDRVVAIHHPATEEKRISFEYDPLTISDYLDDDEDVSADYLRVEDWDVGTTEGGSSGSPIFNAEGQIVGQLSGGFASCTRNEPDWYGAMYSNFERGLDSANNIAFWLDENQTELTFVNGIDYNTCQDLDFLFEPIEKQACNNQDSIIYRFTNTSSVDSVFLDYNLLGVGATAIWTSTPNLGPMDSVDLIITDLENYSNGRHLFEVVFQKAMKTELFSLGLEKSSLPNRPNGIEPLSGQTIFPNSFFSWEQQAGVDEYAFVYAYDSDFADSIEIKLENNEIVLTNLRANEKLHLRVYAINACGISEPLEAAYDIENISCSQFELNLDLPITDLTTLEVPIPVNQKGPLASTVIRNMRGTHSWVSDLKVELYFDPARSIELFDGACPFSSDFDLGFSDLGLEELECPLTSGELYMPNSPFSAWNGTTDIDTFWLQIEDTQDFDEGRLEFVNLEVCTREPSGGFVTEDFSLTMYARDTAPIELQVNPGFFNDSAEIELWVEQAGAFQFISLPNSFTNDLANFDLVADNTPASIYDLRFIASNGTINDTLSVRVEVLPCRSHPELTEVPDTIYRYYHTFSWENTGASSYEFILSDGTDLENSNILDTRNLQDTFYRSPFLRDTLPLYWTVRSLESFCTDGKPVIDSFYTSVDYTVDIGSDTLQLCSYDSSTIRLQIGDRIIDRFFFSVIQDTLTNDIRFRFDPNALQDTNVMHIDVFTGSTPLGTYDFLLVVEDNQNFSDPVQLTIEIIDETQAAELLSPANGEEEVDRFPRFEWENTADSAIWQLSLDADFTEIIYSGEVDNLNGFQFNDQLTPLTKFYWRVLFYTDCGEIQSAVWSFTTDEWVKIEEPLQPNLQVFPNPMQHSLFVILEGVEQVQGEVTLIDGLGRVIYRNQLTKILENGRINTSNLVSGTYVLKIATKESIFTSKVIKQ